MMAYHLGYFGTFVVTIFILGFAVQARANASYAWDDQENVEETLEVIK
jgi:hypothetical protein